jgi:acetylornithine deacetylase/succinyl-diaminopimelate desuccinylase-like protein
MGPQHPKFKRVRRPRFVKLVTIPQTSDEALPARTVPGADLKEIFDEFNQALAIVETAKNSLKGSIEGLTSVAPETLALIQGVRALCALRDTLRSLIAGVKS